MRGTIKGACWTIGLGALVACGSNEAPGREGNLGHGSYLYECDNDQDPACPQGLNVMAQPCSSTFTNSSTVSTQCFPSSVAVGGTFRVQNRPDPGLTNLGNPILNTVSGTYLSATGDGHFKAMKIGSAAIFAQSTVDSTVVDYTILKISPIAKLQINRVATRQQAPPSVAIARGTPDAFSLVAIDTDSHPLAGAVSSFSWEIKNNQAASSFTLLDGANTATMHVGVAGTAGQTDTATLTAYADDSKTVKAAVNLTVQ
jgi:hypothetical protein